MKRYQFNKKLVLFFLVAFLVSSFIAVRLPIVKAQTDSWTINYNQFSSLDPYVIPISLSSNFSMSISSTLDFTTNGNTLYLYFCASGGSTSDYICGFFETVWGNCGLIIHGSGNSFQWTPNTDIILSYDSVTQDLRITDNEGNYTDAYMADNGGGVDLSSVSELLIASDNNPPYSFASGNVSIDYYANQVLVPICVTLSYGLLVGGDSSTVVYVNGNAFPLNANFAVATSSPVNLTAVPSCGWSFSYWVEQNPVTGQFVFMSSSNPVITSFSSNPNDPYVIFGVVLVPSSSPPPTPAPTGSAIPSGTYGGSWPASQSSGFQVSNLNLGTVAANSIIEAQLKFTFQGTNINIDSITLSEPFKDWCTQISQASQTSIVSEAGVTLTFHIPSDVAAGAYNGTITVQATDNLGETYTYTAQVSADIGTSSPSSPSLWIDTHIQAVALLAALAAVIVVVAAVSRKK
jgi:hypothetical protein